jgi:hypothetical protein
LGTAILTMLGTIWIAIQDPLANILSEKVPKSILLLLPLLLLLLLTIAVLYIYYLHKKIKNPIEDYEFDEKIGILHNPKDNLTYCISCLHKEIKSPLKVYSHGWECLNKDCGKFYSNPDYKAPVYQTIHKSKRNWAMDWDKY